MIEISESTGSLNLGTLASSPVGIDIIPYLVGGFYGPVRKNREKQVFFVLIRIAIMDFRGIQLRAKVDKQKILEK